MSGDERVPVSVAWILVIAFGAAILLTNLMRQPAATSDSEFPTTVAGMSVITVPDAIEVQALDAASDVAVSGWFQQAMAVPCPAPLGPVVQLLDGDCSLDMTWLMAEPEGLIRIDANGMGEGAPSSPAVHPVFDGPGIAWARPLPRTGVSTPTPVVFIGHFDDPRAEGCQPEHLQLCRDRLVVTTVAWADGVDSP